MLTYPWKCTVLHCNHLGNTWKPLVLMTQHFDYCPSASESLAPVVSRCFPGGYNVKLYISRGRLAWWLLAFLHSECNFTANQWHQSQTVTHNSVTDTVKTSYCNYLVIKLIHLRFTRTQQHHDCTRFFSLKHLCVYLCIEFKHTHIYDKLIRR